jgi:DNA gyrase/topoisomerase IV subunit B
MADELSDLEQVRRRPTMYVGSTSFWGFVNYVVCAYRFLIHAGATTIHIAADGGKLVLSSDATLAMNTDEFSPFEAILKSDDRRQVHASIDAFIVNALSKELTVLNGNWSYAYERGKRIRQTRENEACAGLTLRFVPDDEIFSVLGVATAILHSYLLRMSFLFPNVRFSLGAGDDRIEYSSPGGMADLFHSISAPYQLLHEPIRLTGNDGDFEMDLVFALHSWSEERMWTFANGGRTADGGTHETGLRDAIRTFTRRMTAAKSVLGGPGFLAVMSFRYPQVQFEGCIKGKIANPELKEKTQALIRTLLKGADLTHLAYLKEMTRFQMADFW